MNNEIQVYFAETIDDFDKEVVRFVKKKKFRKLPQQIDDLISELEVGNFSGSLLKRSAEPVPHEVYKKRLPNEDTKVGKSNGYRVVYLVARENKVIGLLYIYYKKETPKVSETYINGLIDCFLFNLLPDNEDLDENSEIWKEVQQ
ncbi:MAG: hypothetical protein FWG64_09315 [Firmicutes bacterium]|nr:hypothetical protein [Bacillota bacterium]